MSCNRRVFVRSMGALAAGAAAAKPAPLADGDLLSRMQWLNPPAVWNVDGPELRV